MSPVQPAEGRRLGEDLSVKKSEVQVLSPAETFLEGGCGAGVEPGRSIPSSEQVQFSSSGQQRTICPICFLQSKCLRSQGR
jgi:hypothetical protein